MSLNRRASNYFPVKPTIERSRALGERLRAGDASVLREIEDGYRRWLSFELIKAGFRIQAADLDDLCNRLLDRLWRSRGKFDPHRAALHTWTRRIAVRLAADQTKSALRRHRREGTLVDPAALNDIVHSAASVSIRGCEDDASSASTPTAEHRRLCGVLHEAVKRLPANQRMVIRAFLRTSDGIVDYRTLAKRLRVSIETVRRYLRRGRERLRLLCRDIERERERERERDRQKIRPDCLAT